MQSKAKVLGKLLDSWTYLYQNDEVSMKFHSEKIEKIHRLHGAHLNGF